MIFKLLILQYKKIHFSLKLSLAQNNHNISISRKISCYQLDGSQIQRAYSKVSSSFQAIDVDCAPFRTISLFLTPFVISSHQLQQLQSAILAIISYKNYIAQVEIKLSWQIHSLAYIAQKQRSSCFISLPFTSATAFPVVTPPRFTSPGLIVLLPTPLQFIMEAILSELHDRRSWKESMRKTCRQNTLNVELAAYFTPLKFKSCHANFLHAHTRRPSDHADRWLQNELKAFYWTCVALSCTRDRKISAFGEEEWNSLQAVFPFKKRVTLQYEALRMTVEAGKQMEWTTQQDTYLSQILNSEEEKFNKWNYFARQLFERSQGKFLRSGKQCRERWLNHLDPSKKHGNWTQQEDKALVLMLLQVGKRWAKVAQRLGSARTQHMVKNRYKTIIGQEKRRQHPIKDEEMLLRQFLQAEGYSKEGLALLDFNTGENLQKSDLGKYQPQDGTQVLKKTQMKDQHLQVKRQNAQMKGKSQEKCRRGFLEEVREEEFKNLVMDDEDQKESFLRLGTPLLRDMPQAHSPWFMGVPITPTPSPNLSFFINVSNFSALENQFASSFYNARRDPEESEL